MKRDYLGVLDLSREETEEVILLAERLKRPRYWGHELAGKTIALIFEKPSLRTRVTFDLAVRELGGYGLYLDAKIGMGKREAVEDVARNLERWTHGIVARVFSQETLVRMAKVVDIPVINALSDLEHPCQVLADFQTMHEITGEFKWKLAFVGDGNNVAVSLMLMSALMGTDFTIACPEGYEPPEEAVRKAQELAKKTGAKIEIVREPADAVRDAQFIYTDVWTSMGQEAEAEERRRVFGGKYQVNAELLAKAPSEARVLHCLPAHRGEEITDEVLDGPQAVVFDQAENRLHAQKALLKFLYS